MGKIKAFFLGMWEFRLSTTSVLDDEVEYAYLWGREWAHRLTFRHYEVW